jgi:hypothetical protein
LFLYKLQYILVTSVLLLSSYIVATVIGQDYTAIIESLGTRMLLFGDSVLYYYTSDSIAYFSYIKSISYLGDELNPILGFFRLVEYNRPLGFLLVDYNTNFAFEASTFGPNVPYYTKGYIYFGPFGAIAYSFFIGGVVGFVRQLIYTNAIRSQIGSVLVIHLNLIIFSIAQDSQLFISILFDTLIISLPFVLLTIGLHFSQIKKYFEAKNNLVL